MVCRRIWKGEEWPREWREGIIVPILEKGEGDRVEEYRGVTLTQTGYVAILAERLRNEVERNGMISASQTGFRKGVGTIDNIIIEHMLNYLINRQVGEKGGRMIAVFLDLKAAFDSVDRGVLIEAMKAKGVREGLIERCGEVLRERR